MKPRPFRPLDGFSLIEMAIVLLIVGIFTATSVNLYSTLEIKTRTKTFKSQIESITSAIDAYIDQSGHLPCPASFISKFGDREFGEVTNCRETMVPPGMCKADGSYCIQAGRITEHENLSKGIMRVRIGAVPARALNIPFEMMRDPQGNYITYAVTELLASSRQDYDRNDGAIDVIDVKGHSVLTPAKTAAYVLVTHGADKTGAVVYNNGGTPFPCPGAATLDGQNCDYSMSSIRARDAIFRTSFLSATGNKDNYDDMIVYKTKLRKLVNGVIACKDQPICTAKNIGVVPVCKIRGGSNNMPLCVQREDLRGGTNPDKPFNHDITTWKDACDWGEDWKKPTIEELRVLLEKKDEIGGFKEGERYLSRTAHNPELLGNSDLKLKIWSKEAGTGTEKAINITPEEGNNSGRIRCIHY